MSVGEERKAFEDQLKIQKLEQTQRKLEQIKKIAEARALSQFDEAELQVLEAKQELAEKAFRLANPNKIYSRDIAEEDLQEPYNDKLNEMNYLSVLNKSANISQRGVSNKDYSIHRIFQRTDSKSDGEVYLWYPHVFEKDSENKFGDSSVVHVSQLGDLEKYGAYHFQIRYYPRFRQTLSNVINHAIKDLTKEINEKNLRESGEKIVNTFKSRFEGLGSAGQEIANEFTIALKRYRTTRSYQGFVRGMQLFLKKTLNEVLNITPQSVFSGESGLIANIYLPLNKMEIRRESGVTSKSNVVTNIGTAILKQTLDWIIPKTDNPKKIVETIKKTYNDARARMVSEFKAPRLKNPELDIREFQWELIPRTSEEHRHIMHILSFFASLSVPTFERNDMLFYMPPILTMRVLSSKIKSDYEFESYVLVPEWQYYLLEYSANFNYSEDSVMLDENGMPVGVTLNIRLIKNELVTGKDLFNSPLI